MPNSLGPAELLLHYGTDEQRNHYLPRLARGDDIPCFALTGPLAGSDAGAMPDTGIICKGQWEGQEVIGLRLNWEKRYITLGPVATLLGPAFKAYDPDHLLGEEEDLGISLALIPTDTAGVEIGRRHLPLGAAFMNGPNSGKDVFIPLDYLIGGQEMLGKGWMMLMNCLSVGRSISLPAVGTGAAKFTSLVTGQYAQIREQFNVPLSAFEGIQEAMARIGGNAWMMDAARMLTANAVDLGEKPSVLSAILKYHLTERGRECISHAMDVHGGKAIIMGPNNYLGRSWNGAPIFITVEGANILSRNLMIFGQGAIRCHPFVLKEMALAGREDKDQALKEFDGLLLKHIGFAVSNAASTLVLNLGLGHFEHAPGDRISQGYFRALNRQAAAFAMLADFSMMLLGGELKRRERLSARLGDVLSNLYLASAALKRYHDLDSPAYMEPLFRWAMEESLGQSERALDELLSNFPNKVFGCLLRVIVFPFGRRHKGPSGQTRRRSRCGHRSRQRRSGPRRIARRLLPPAIGGRCRGRAATRQRPAQCRATAPQETAHRTEERPGQTGSRRTRHRCRAGSRRAASRRSAKPARRRSGPPQGDRRRRFRQRRTDPGRGQSPLNPVYVKKRREGFILPRPFCS